MQSKKTTKKHRILFDARILADSLVKNNARTGIYTTAYNICRGLLNRTDIELLLYGDKPSRLRKYVRLNLLAHECNITNSLYSHKDIDAFFSPGTTYYPLLKNVYHGISCYNIIYDVIPLIHPEYFPYSQSVSMAYMLDNFEINDHYFSISEYTKNDCIKLGRGIGPNQFTVIPLAANERFYPNKGISQLRQVKQKYGIPKNKKYILSLCTREPRKNLINSIKAFTEFIEKNNISDTVYVLAGSIWDMFRQQLRSCIDEYKNHSDKIIEIGYVDDNDLAALYSNAEWFVYTPHYEGFGLPPLEAMQCGCPVVTSNSSSLPEVVGNAALLVDSHDISQHTHAYEQYYFSSELRQKTAEYGIERAKAFSWDTCVNQITDKIILDIESKRRIPRATIIATLNLPYSDASIESHEHCLKSIAKQEHSNLQLIVLDGGGREEVSKLISELTVNKNMRVRRVLCENIFFALNQAIADVEGEFLFLLSPNASYQDPMYVSTVCLKMQEHRADVAYTDTLVKSENIIIPSDVRRLPSGDYFNSCSVCVRTSLFEELGGFNNDFGAAAFDHFIMRLISSGKRFIKVDGIHSAIETKLHRPSNVIDEYISAFYGVFGCDLKLSRKDIHDLYDSRCIRLYSAQKILEIAAKLKFQGWGEALIERMIHVRSMARLTYEDRTHFVSNSRHLLLGFIPLKCYQSGNAINSTVSYSLGKLPLFKITRHEGARLTFYLFNFIPLLRIKCK